MNMIIGDHIKQISFTVTDLGKANLFLGYEWLQHHNPTIDWKLSRLNLDKCRTWCRRITEGEEPKDVEDNIKEVEKEERILYINLKEEVLRRNKVEKEKVESEEKIFEETVRKEY